MRKKIGIHKSTTSKQIRLENELWKRFFSACLLCRSDTYFFSFNSLFRSIAPKWIHSYLFPYILFPIRNRNSFFSCVSSDSCFMFQSSFPSLSFFLFLTHILIHTYIYTRNLSNSEPNWPAKKIWIKVARIDIFASTDTYEHSREDNVLYTIWAFSSQVYIYMEKVPGLDNYLWTQIWYFGAVCSK